jgi:hypothetical protein
MTRLIPDPTWATLKDVSQGRFLDCLLQDKEFFYRYELSGENTEQPRVPAVLSKSSPDH